MLKTSSFRSFLQRPGENCGLILLAGWIALKVFLFCPLTIYVTNAEEMQVGFHSLVFLYLIPFLVFGAILVFSGLALPAGPRRCYVAILAAIGGLLWLQGDVLIWGYGSLDGLFIDWQREAWKGYVDSSIWLAVLVAAVSWRRHLVPRVRSGVLLLLAIQLGSLLFMNPWAALVLSVKVYPFVVKELLPYQRVLIHVNDQFIGEWVLAERALRSRSIEVPANFFQEEEVVVGFKFPDAATPREMGVNCDVRTLAVRFASIWLHDGPAS